MLGLSVAASANPADMVSVASTSKLLNSFCLSLMGTSSFEFVFKKHLSFFFE
jgi:hypothetical protein